VMPGQPASTRHDLFGNKELLVKSIYVDHLASWPLVDGALLVVVKREAQPQTLAKLMGTHWCRSKL
jgi:hypothetical protein